MKLCFPARARCALAMAAVLTLAGCNQHASEADKAAAAQEAAARQQQADEAAAMRRTIPSAEQQLAQLPPPAKGRYLQVRSTEAWRNPFLLVGWKTMTLRLVVPNGAGGNVPVDSPIGQMRLSPSGKGEVNLRLIGLPQALASLPPECWPYGRVLAVEEDPTTPRRQRPQMRRNLEAVLALLNDLDVVADEWPYGQR